jgi:hypothetical protein
MLSNHRKCNWKIDYIDSISTLHVEDIHQEDNNLLYEKNRDIKNVINFNVQLNNFVLLSENKKKEECLDLDLWQSICILYLYVLEPISPIGN